MSQIIGVQGRCLSSADLEEIRQWIGTNPEGSRYRLSRHLCVLWNWRNEVGQFKDMAARTLLLKLEQRGFVQLPPRRMASPNRHRLGPARAQHWDMHAVEGSLQELRPLHLQEVSQNPQGRAQVRSALGSFHYLGYRTPVGQNLQYGLSDKAGRLLAVMVFGAAAWKCAARDQWIGWTSAQREQGLARIANNSRFLILPWVRVPHLASWMLGKVTARIAEDWYAKYGHRVSLLETFVQRHRFAGTSYRAANWIYVGATTGRSRQDREHRLQVPLKDVYLYGLAPKVREQLCR